MIVHISEHGSWLTKTMLLSTRRRPKVKAVMVWISTGRRAQVKVVAVWLLRLYCVILMKNNVLVYS